MGMSMRKNPYVGTIADSLIDSECHCGHLVRMVDVAVYISNSISDFHK